MRPASAKLHRIARIVRVLRAHGHQVIVAGGRIWAATEWADRRTGQAGVRWEDISHLTPSNLREWLGY